MNKSLSILVLTTLVSQFSFASTFVCTSKADATGGTVSVKIEDGENGQAMVSLFAQGGRAHFISSQGPFEAVVKGAGDAALYTFQDSAGETREISVVTSPVGGKVMTVASADFGMWQGATMYCK